MKSRVAEALRDSGVARQATAPRVLFLGSLYAGHRTRFLNLRAHTQADPRISPEYRSVSGWVEDGLLEQLPFLPRAMRGRLRALAESSSVARFPRPDAIWTAAVEVIAPYLLAMRGPLRRPLALDLDSTVEQLDGMAPYYYGRPPKRGLRKRMTLLLERVVWRNTSLFLPRSRWAADGLRARGVRDELIQIVPSGVNLHDWQPPLKPKSDLDSPLRLLFVGGDFVRKGGDMLLEVFRKNLRGKCELDIVTYDPVEAEPGIRIHRAGPNSATLRQLFADADLFVLPTRAECFGIAAVEAMASGLPVIMGNVGGAADIVSHGENGWLIEPAETDLARVLDHALAVRDRLPAMGAISRAIATQRFDGEQNDRLIVDLLIEEVERWRQSKN